jgi:single-strand DNA-binding protein
MNYNKTVLVGKLVRDNELRHIGDNNIAVVNNSIAVNRTYKQGDDKKEETTFVDFSIFGRTAEILEQYTTKGSEVLLEGRLHNERWETAEGDKRSKLILKVDSLQLGSKPSTNEDTANATSSDVDGDVPF